VPVLSAVTVPLALRDARGEGNSWAEAGTRVGVGFVATAFGGVFTEAVGGVVVAALFGTGIGETIAVIAIAGVGAVAFGEAVDQVLTASWRHWDDIRDRTERMGGWAKDRASDAWHAVTHVFGLG
jgi:hypothetical protein